MIIWQEPMPYGPLRRALAVVGAVCGGLACAALVLVLVVLGTSALGALLVAPFR